MNDQAKGLRNHVHQRTMPVAKTISIVSGKGGVGKSNFAVNYALELIERGKTVLIIDLDVGMGNIDILLGLHSKKTIVELLENHLSIEDIVTFGPNGLAYISGGSSLSRFLKMDDKKHTHFFSEYERIMKAYDFIIFDMGAGATEDSLSFILATDECFVITTPEPTAIIDGYGMIKYIVNNQRNMPIYIVMNRCHSLEEGQKIIEKFKHIIWQFLNKNVTNIGILLEDSLVSTSVKRQIPYVILNHKAKISQSIKNIVNDYLLGLEVNYQKPLTFLDKFKQLIKAR